jgi:hypothetical protein
VYDATPLCTFTAHQLVGSMFARCCPHLTECPPAAGRYLATADRDNKVRMSILPAEPLKVGIDSLAFNVLHIVFA